MSFSPPYPKEDLLEPFFHKKCEQRLYIDDKRVRISKLRSRYKKIADNESRTFITLPFDIVPTPTSRILAIAPEVGVLRITGHDCVVENVLKTSVLKLNSRIFYPVENTISMFKFNPDSTSPIHTSWIALKHAHTPYYKKSELNDIICDHFTAFTDICTSIKNKTTIIALRYSYHGYTCLRCGETFDTIEKWAHHYPVLVPYTLGWAKVKYCEDSKTLKTIPVSITLKPEQPPEPHPRHDSKSIGGDLHWRRDFEFRIKRLRR
jgi:hypothetical protein